MEISHRELEQAVNDHYVEIAPDKHLAKAPSLATIPPASRASLANDRRFDHPAHPYVVIAYSTIRAQDTDDFVQFALNQTHPVQFNALRRVRREGPGAYYAARFGNETVRIGAYSFKDLTSPDSVPTILELGAVEPNESSIDDVTRYWMPREAILDADGLNDYLTPTADKSIRDLDKRALEHVFDRREFLAGVLHGYKVTVFTFDYPIA